MTVQLRTVLNQLSQVAIVGVATLALVVSNAQAESQFGSVKLEANFGFKFICTFAATGNLKQTASDIVGGTGIPYAQALANELLLDKGSGRCVVARTDGSGKLIGKKKPTFVQRAYDASGARKAETTGSCWNLIAQPACFPKPVKGGGDAVGVSACFELSATESSDNKTHSVVFQIGMVPASMEANQSVADTACSTRKF